jgi:phage N-6-adenine-methyltransferase
MAKFPSLGRQQLAKPARAGPTIRRGQSEQAVSTPWEFIHAVEPRFGTIQVDLAATAENAKAPLWITPEENSFAVDWHKFNDGLLWLNPEFDNITPWVRKCAYEAKRGAHILLLCRASVDANWWWDYVYGRAVVYTLTPRIIFEGQTIGYPSPLALCTYNVANLGGYYDPRFIYRWHWKTDVIDIVEGAK